jgi:hypothetical protein
VTLLGAYAAAQTPPVKLQVYPGRPRSIYAPCAFVDAIRESIDYTQSVLSGRTAEVDVVVLHGLMDTAEAATQKDAFVDGFLAYVYANIHAAGGIRTFGAVSTEDVPDYVPDWLPPNEQRTYYGSRITLQGYEGGFA